MNENTNAKTILIAGKEIPDGEDLAFGAETANRNVLITAEQDSLANTKTGAIIVPWNRCSPLSARSVILSCMNQTNSFDEAILVFDESLFVSKYQDVNAAEVTRCLEELIAGYQFLTLEIIAKFKHNNFAHETVKPGKIAFVWISAQSRSQVNVNVNPLVLASSAAFKAFAEATSKSLIDVEEVLPIMVNVENSNEIAKKDSSLVGWLCEYMDAIDNLQKRPGAKFFEIGLSLELKILAVLDYLNDGNDFF